MCCYISRRSTPHLRHFLRERTLFEREKFIIRQPPMGEKDKGQVNWGGVHKTALKRYTKSRRGHPRKEEKGS